MKLTLGNIKITKIGHSSGVFYGNNNTHKQFRSESILNEVVGSLSGDENTITHSNWVKTKGRKDE